MIITVSTIVLLVLAVLSLALALYGGYISLSISDDSYSDDLGNRRSEQKYYLLGMIGLIVLAARLIAAPLFFWMLQSLVPYCPGAMCVSGVVNVSEPFSSLGMMFKLTVPALYGLWIVIEVANRRTKNLPLIGLLAKSFTLLLLPLLIVESSLDVLLVSLIRPVYAPCCSSVYDVDPPFSPSAILGPEVGFAIIIALLAVASIVIIAQLTDVSLKKRFVLILCLSPLLALLYVTAIHDTIAPITLGLSSHHCPYCLFQEFPDTAVFAGLFWIGVATSIWRVGLEFLWKKHDLPKEHIRGMLLVLGRISVVSIIFSLTSAISHLLVAF